LEQQVASSNELSQAKQRLQDQQTRLAELTERYAAEHPDVVQARKQVQTLKDRVEELRQAQEEGGGLAAADPESQGSMELTSRLQSIEMEIQNAKQELAELKKKYEVYQQRIEKSPRVEQQYKALQRDYDNLKTEYQETKARLMEAREAQELERSRVSQKLKIINPPVVPGKPSEPNRLAILLVGAVLASGFGVGSGSLAEILDKSLHSVKGLAGMAPRPVLVSIPYIQTKRDRRRRLIKRLSLGLGIIAGAAALLLAVHTFFRPLDHILGIMIERWRVFF
jgi:uncharacterized protein involved in exopolysaccharide biosynthesis